MNPRSHRLRSRLAAIVGFAVCLVNGSVPPEAAETGLAPSVRGPGQLEGQIRLVGKAPAPPILMKFPNGLAVPDESLVVDSESGGIANVFIYLKNAPQGAVIPLAPKEAVTLQMCGFRFVPHSATVRAGQPFRCVNFDPQPNNVQFQAIRNANVNWLLKPGAEQELTWDRSERLPFRALSNIIPMMRASILVLDHPWCAVTDTEGRFAIPDLPPGRHEFILWHELAGYLDRKWVVEIAAGKATTKDADFDLARFGRWFANQDDQQDSLCVGPFDLEQAGNGDGLVAGRRLLEKQLTAKLNRLDQRIQLTDEQRKKLERAGAGEIQHLLDEVQRVRAEYARVKADREQLKQFQDETLPELRARLSTGLFGARSLLGKTQNSVLTSEQKARLNADSTTSDGQETKLK